MKVSYRRLWVIEMWNEKLKRWDPTCGVAPDRNGCRVHLNDWKRIFAEAKFRIRMYLPEEEII